MNDTPITRRSALTTGTLFLAALAAGLLGTTTVPATAAPIADIGRAEALLQELLRLLPALEDRDRSNVGQVLEIMADAAGLVEPGFSDGLAIAAEHIGPGNRVMDRVDQAEAAQRRAAITYPVVVAQYAERYHAGDLNAGPAIRAELAEVYGDDLGEALDRAAFKLHLCRRHHTGCVYPACHDD